MTSDSSESPNLHNSVHVLGIPQHCKQTHGSIVRVRTCVRAGKHPGTTRIEHSERQPIREEYGLLLYPAQPAPPTRRLARDASYRDQPDRRLASDPDSGVILKVTDYLRAYLYR